MLAVVGAGPTGLALAWRLTRAGHEVVVLEASAHVGGMAGSRTISGQRVDLGSHRLPTDLPADLREAIDELVELQERPRNDRIRLGDRWVPYPLRPTGLLRGLGASIALRATVDAASGALRSPRDDSYAEVVRSKAGPTAWAEFHEPYAWKLWGTDPTLLSGELARRRLPDSSPADIVRRSARNVRDTPTYRYPRRGFGALSEAMAELVPDVRLETKVTGLIEHDDRVIVGLADGRIVTASHVFSTLSAGLTATWLGLAEPERVVLPVRAMVLVYLTVAGRPYTPFEVHHLPDRTVLPTRVSEPANHRTSATDPTDRTVVCAEIPCWPDDAVWRSGTAELGRRVADDLVRASLPDPQVLSVDVQRLPSAYPVMTAESLAALDRAERALGASRRVTVLGRQGLFTPDHTHHVLQMGFEAAACVTPDGSFDHAAWRRARDGFREFVVRD